MIESSGTFQNKAKLITRRMFILNAIKVVVFLGIISRFFATDTSRDPPFHDPKNSRLHMSVS